MIGSVDVLHQSGPFPSDEKRARRIVAIHVMPSRVTLTFLPSAKERET